MMFLKNLCSKPTFVIFYLIRETAGKEKVLDGGRPIVERYMS